MTEGQILIVDDEVNIRNALAKMMERRGYGVATAGGGEEALKQMARRASQVVTLDLKMPDADGLDLLRRIRNRWPETEVIVMTAYGSIETAVEAMKAGAYDYLPKPIDKDRFPIAIEKALERRRLADENRQLRKHLNQEDALERMLGQSEAIRQIHEMVDLVAANELTVLLTGESGSGKELVARAIHQRSRRASGPFITVNCGALPESVFESEVFGYEKGAFTGASATKPGRFELADGGTLFLDEVGELSLKNQVDFLRVLETLEFRRLGGTKLIRVNVRVVAATNRDLHKAVEEGRFREDLFYRLNVIPIALPPLRERREDIPLLIEAFLSELTAVHQTGPKEFTQETMQRMMEYRWPGNIRELKNVVSRLVVTVKDPVIRTDHLPKEIHEGFGKEKAVEVPLGHTLQEVERRVIERTLAELTHHREKAAKVLGISPRALQYKIKAYGIKE